MAANLQDAVILFGDSLTSRQDVPSTLQALMSQWYRRQLDVLNRGFGGYNTRIATPLFDRIFVKKGTENAPTIRLVTLWFGTNDACLPQDRAKQHVPLPDFRSNLTNFLDNLTSSTSPYAVAHPPKSQKLSIVLITPPPFYPEMLDGPLVGSRTMEETKKYVDVVKEVGEDFGARLEGEEGRVAIAVIDLWSLMLDAAGGEGEGLRPFLTDGLHLSTKGYAVLWEAYTKLVKTSFKGRGLDWEDLKDCPFTIPDFADVDMDRPESVLDGIKSGPGAH